MEILLSLLLLLVVARLLGEIAERGKIPALIGEIAAGIVLGPTLLGLLAPDAGLVILADLGIFFLIYLAALELTLEDMKRSIRDSGVYIAIPAFVIPALLGTMLGTVLGFELRTAIFLGIALAFTAVPVSIRILEDLDLLRTDFGRALVSAGLLCDIAGLATVGVLLNLGGATGLDALGAVELVLKFAVFGMTMLLVDQIFRHRQGALGSWILRHTRTLATKGTTFALPFLVGLGFAFFADLLGLHFVVGVFFGTLIVAEHVISDQDAVEVRRATSAITRGVFGPVFFAFIGLSFVGASLGNPLLVFVILGMAITTKLLGGYVGAWWAKFPLRERIGMGVGVNGRGAMELVIATIGLELGFIDTTLFSILVLTGIVTTLMTPIGLRLLFHPPRVVSPIPSGQDGKFGGANGGI